MSIFSIAEEYYQEFDEDDEMMFGKYHKDSLISKNIILFELDRNQYQARVIIDGFKVIIEGINAGHLKIQNEFLNENVTLISESLTKNFAAEIAVNLITAYQKKLPKIKINGDYLIIRGFKLL